MSESQRKGRTGVSAGRSAKNLKPRRVDVSRLGGLADVIFRQTERRKPFRKKQTKFPSEPVDPLAEAHKVRALWPCPCYYAGRQSVLMQSVVAVPVSSQAGGKCVMIASFLTGV